MKVSKEQKKYYEKYSKNLVWKKQSKKIISIDRKENRYYWFDDGVLSPYENFITSNLKKKNKDKTAIITVSKNNSFKRSLNIFEL